MGLNKKCKRELTEQLLRNREHIVSQWASQIMKVQGHRKYKDVIPEEKHKPAMRKFFKFFIDFLKNQHDANCLKYLTSLILEGFLSINTAEDVIHGQMVLRKVLVEIKG